MRPQAEQRWHMDSREGLLFVQMPFTEMGKQFLIGLRKGRDDLFAHQRIKSVLQMDPDIPVGTIVDRV